MIYAIAGERVTTNREVVDLLQRIGHTHGFDTEVSIAWARGNDFMWAYAPLEYYHELDLTLTDAERTSAFLDGAWDSVWLGFGEEAACILGSVGRDLAIGIDGGGWKADNLFRRTGACIAAEKQRMADQGRRYPDAIRGGEVTGAFVSVYRGMIGGLRVIRTGTAARIAQSGAIARLMRNVMIEASEGAIHTIGTREPGETMERTFERLVEAGAFGAGIAIVTTRRSP